jgi:hypothetical protein
MQLHCSIRDSLKDSILEQEFQTIKLKKIISELEESPTPKPLFAQPLAILLAENLLQVLQEPQSQLGKFFNC